MASNFKTKQKSVQALVFGYDAPDFLEEQMKKEKTEPFSIWKFRDHYKCNIGGMAYKLKGQALIKEGKEFFLKSEKSFLKDYKEA